ncbi:DinB family protein [Amycolatopsis endophytica]|nr:DinB family protein [Amycolatopsis endophytica]
MFVPRVGDERDGLLAFLAQQRDALRIAAHGLTDEEAWLVPTRSALSIGGLVKHVAGTEQSWMDSVRQRERPALALPDSLESVLDAYAEVTRETEETVAEVADLGTRVPAPRGVRGFLDDGGAWSVRWVLLHLIQETARHAGHADILREHLDGATPYPLLAAAQGWVDEG